MEKIESLELLESYLKEGRVICTIAKSSVTRFVWKQELIHVYGEHAHYTLTFQDFLDLFSHESLYLYEKDEEYVEISKEKDDEYYGWYHK